MATPSGKTLAEFIDRFGALYFAIHSDLTCDQSEELTQAEAELTALDYVLALEPVLDTVMVALDGAGFVDWGRGLGLEKAFSKAAQFVRALVRDQWKWGLAAAVNYDALKAEARRRQRALGPAKQRADSTDYLKNFEPAVREEARRRHREAGLSETPADLPAFQATYNAVEKSYLETQAAGSAEYRSLKNDPLVGDKAVRLSYIARDEFFQLAKGLVAFRSEIERVIALEDLREASLVEAKAQLHDMREAELGGQGGLGPSPGDQPVNTPAATVAPPPTTDASKTLEAIHDRPDRPKIKKSSDPDFQRDDIHPSCRSPEMSLIQAASLFYGNDATAGDRKRFRKLVKSKNPKAFQVSPQLWYFDLSDMSLARKDRFTSFRSGS